MSSPKTVKAITVAQPGDVDVLELTEQPFPENKSDHVLIKVEKAGVNFIDTYFRKGIYPAKSYPDVQGIEAAGTIVALPTDAGVLSKEEYKKRSFKLGGKVAAIQRGAFAEYISVPWSTAIPVPDDVSTETAAACLLQGLTALTFMTEAHDVKAGETVLIHTVAGGLGLLMAQLAKARGARVIGTTSTEEKAILAREAGADEVILYKNEDTVKRVLELTGGKGVQAVFDGIGKDTFEANFDILARKGTLVSIGNASGPVPPFPPLKLAPKNLRLVRPTVSSYIIEPEESGTYGVKLFEQIASGALKVRVFKKYPFSTEGVRQAQTDLAGGNTAGKLIINVA